MTYNAFSYYINDKHTEKQAFPKPKSTRNKNEIKISLFMIIALCTFDDI